MAMAGAPCTRRRWGSHACCPTLLPVQKATYTRASALPLHLQWLVGLAPTLRNLALHNIDSWPRCLPHLTGLTHLKMDLLEPGFLAIANGNFRLGRSLSALRALRELRLEGPPGGPWLELGSLAVLKQLPELSALHVKNSSTVNLAWVQVGATSA